jgi:hypothetical protein
MIATEYEVNAVRRQQHDVAQTTLLPPRGDLTLKGDWHVAAVPAIFREEALQNIRQAIKLCLEVRAEQGLPLTVETRQVEVAV